jgi:phage/plasmid-like protein (TIGR03299 family)|tara:strand:- start:726 stop:1733 length:1008 start_codon:yes stop_codon:yes gene_type:complete
MAHGIEETDGMMYVGEAPWHRLGVELDNPATAQEAIIAANMDWEVAKEPVYVYENGTYVEIPSKKAIVRQDTRRIFNVLSDSYTPLQNADAFGFMDEIVGTQEGKYETCGTLDNGRLFWLLIKLPKDDLSPVPDDKVDSYILLASSHDGTMAVKVFPTPIRVVCGNTLAMAFSRMQNGFYARHTATIQSKVSEARRVLNLTDYFYDNTRRAIDQLVHKRMTEGEMVDIFKQVYDIVDKVDSDKKLDQRKQNALDETVSLLYHPTNMHGGIQGTAYQAFNALTYYQDHMRTFRGQDKQDQEWLDSKRLESSWMGGGKRIRDKATALLLPDFASSGV